MKSISRFAVWSNIFFIVPLILSIQHKISFYIPILLLSIIFSFLYHETKEKKFGVLDTLFALLLIIANLVLLILGEFTPPYFYIAIGLVLPAGFFYFKQFKHNYNINHGFYHVFSALITIFSILTFVK